MNLHAPMTASTLVRRIKIYLHPGQMIATPESSEVTTILGSCVAVCLYDAQSGIGGMNHFLLPCESGEGTAAGRFGDRAVPELIEKLLALGAAQKGLQAKLFGGACVLEAFRDREDHLGNQNVRVARQILAQAAIPIVGADVEGGRGRKLVFYTDDGSAWVKPL